MMCFVHPTMGLSCNCYDLIRRHGHPGLEPLLDITLSFTSRWVWTISLSCCDFITLTPVSSYRTNTISAWWRRTPRTRTSRNTSPCATTSSTPPDCAVATCSSTGELTLHPCPISYKLHDHTHSLTHWLTNWPTYSYSQTMVKLLVSIFLENPKELIFLYGFHDGSS